jgi:hypothetical protein
VGFRDSFVPSTNKAIVKYSREEWKDKFTTQHSLDAETGYRVLLVTYKNVLTCSLTN